MSSSSSQTVIFDTGQDHSRRELAGYGVNPPDPQWPNNAKVCLSFVLNYEEGGEHNTGRWDENYNEDEFTEMFLTESGVAASVPGSARHDRNLGIESGYEYGAHRGFHRILELFKRKDLRFTSWAVGRAVQLNPQVVDLMENAGCEVASHSWRWIDYWDMSEEEEKKHVRLAIEAIRKASSKGTVPEGWYTGRQSIRTRRIVYEVYRELGMLDQYYDSDACELIYPIMMLRLNLIFVLILLTDDEDLPYYVKSPSSSKDKPSPPVLVIPYTLDNNDMVSTSHPFVNLQISFLNPGIEIWHCSWLLDSFSSEYISQGCLGCAYRRRQTRSIKDDVSRIALQGSGSTRSI